MKHFASQAMLGHKGSPDEFKIIEIIQSMCSEHNRIKLENGKKENLEIYKLNKLRKILNNQWIKELTR
jgi:hypothetical protein